MTAFLHNNERKYQLVVISRRIFNAFFNKDYHFCEDMSHENARLLNCKQTTFMHPKFKISDSKIS